MVIVVGARYTEGCSICPTNFYEVSSSRAYLIRVNFCTR